MLEYWSIGFKNDCCLFLFFHHPITPVLLLILGFLPHDPDLIENGGRLFFDHKMHAPVFGAVRFGFACGNGALFAETDGYQPLSFDAFSD